MITKAHRHDTMAILKITNWRNTDILKQLNQHSTVDDKWFIREVRIGGGLYKRIQKLYENYNLEIEVIKTYCSPSEKERQVRSDAEVGIHE